jgi:hypothetical protein
MALVRAERVDRPVPGRVGRGQPVSRAYIAARVAHRLDGPDGYAVERWWQSESLARRPELGQV